MRAGARIGDVNGAAAIGQRDLERVRRGVADVVSGVHGQTGGQIGGGRGDAHLVAVFEAVAVGGDDVGIGSGEGPPGRIVRAQARVFPDFREPGDVSETAQAGSAGQLTVKVLRSDAVIEGQGGGHAGIYDGDAAEGRGTGLVHFRVDFLEDVEVGIRSGGDGLAADVAALGLRKNGIDHGATQHESGVFDGSGVGVLLVGNRIDMLPQNRHVLVTVHGERNVHQQIAGGVGSVGVAGGVVIGRFGREDPDVGGDGLAQAHRGGRKVSGHRIEHRRLDFVTGEDALQQARGGQGRHNRVVFV